MNEFYNPITLKTQNIKVLITGATGYIGGRLIPRLLANNIKVRILVRDKTKIDGKSWFSKVEIFEGDLTKLESLSGLCDGIDQAFYLVHSMSNSKEYIELDRLSARNFVKIAKMKISHVIYLGGISGSTRHTPGSTIVMESVVPPWAGFTVGGFHRGRVSPRRGRV